MSKLLAGIRVLDLTTVLAGPFAAYQLSLFGAEVLKVEMPVTGDLSREIGDNERLRKMQMGASFLAQNAGKKSVTVNLKTSGGREVLSRLAADADVLLENMRPGVLTRLGFPWSYLRELNPRLVYCALSGFGQTGPLASRPAYDQIVQGLAGMSDVTGSPAGGPLRVGFPICDTVGGLAAAMAVCAALARRAADGQGCSLDVSMLETALTSMGWVVSNHLIAGRTPERLGNENPTSAPSGTFDTGEGALNIATNTQQQFEALCKVADCSHLVADTRFLSRGERKENRAALRGELEKALLRRSAKEWEVLLSEASVPAGRLLTVDEALHQDQIRARGLLHEVPLESDQPDEAVTVLGNGVHVDGSALAPSCAPPRLGEHTDSILAEAGFTSKEIASLRATHAI